jgi:hypothetical protein
MSFLKRSVRIIVIPAKAGIHFDLAGKQMDSGFRRNDGMEGMSES